MRTYIAFIYNSAKQSKTANHCSVTNKQIHMNVDVNIFNLFTDGQGDSKFPDEPVLFSGC